MGAAHIFLKGLVCLTLMLSTDPNKPKRSFFPPILGPAIKRASLDHNVNIDLICAVIQQESAGNPWASRFEPRFYDHYIKGKTPNELPGHWPSLKVTTTQTEAFNRAKSFGLMQIMGNTARLHGFNADFLDQLFDISTNIDMGTLILASMLKKHGGDTEKALLAWNGGGNKKYPKEVLEKVANGSAKYLMAV